MNRALKIFVVRPLYRNYVYNMRILHIMIPSNYYDYDPLLFFFGWNRPKLHAHTFYAFNKLVVSEYVDEGIQCT